MTLHTNLAVLLVIACISQQFMVANCQGSKKRGMKKKEKDGQPKVESQPKPSIPERYRSPKVIGVFKGKFSTKDKTQCRWVATGDDAYALGVNCKKGEKSFECEYVARPATCPGYESNAKAYWKQIARSLKKQMKLCIDSTALIKAGMCRNAPRDAHFKLNKKTQDIVVPPPRTTVQPPSASSETTSGAKSCAVHNKKLAEGYCADSWSSVCAFLFSMVQNDEC